MKKEIFNNNKLQFFHKKYLKKKIHKYYITKSLNNFQIDTNQIYNYFKYNKTAIEYYLIIIKINYVIINKKLYKII